MREIPVLLMVCMVALGLPQDNSPTLDSKQTLDDLINQIFTQDNSEVNSSASNPNTFVDQPSTIPTPTIGQGGGGNGQFNPSYNNGGGVVPQTPASTQYQPTPDPTSYQPMPSHQPNPQTVSTQITFLL